MKRTDPKQIGEIISEMIAATGQEQTFDEQRICYLWPEVVGPAVNRYTMRRYVDRGTLHVYLSSASLKNDLLYMRERLVGLLNEAAGRHVIDSIQIH
jgi:predicted nucleic acid-binding Zn ribbon protein